MDIKHQNDKVFLSQKNLIEKGIDIAGIHNCHLVKTPLNPGIQLKEASEQEKHNFNLLKINYRTHTGILNYLARQTRPDLASAVSILSSFNNSPRMVHWKQIIHCWKNLAGSIYCCLILCPDHIDKSKCLQHFTDSTWADDAETCLSRSGSICFWKSVPLAWNSKKKRNITISSTEAEFNSLSNGVQENLWIKSLLEELYCTQLHSTIFNVDNKGLLDKINKFGSNSETKHLEIKAKWLRDLKENNDLTVKLVSSSYMIAD